MKGRKAVLTPTGEFLYRRARALVEEAEATERAAKKLSAGWEAEIGIAMDVAFPSWLLLQCLARFGDESPHTRIEVIESVLGGTAEALLLGQAQLAITGMVPQGFVGELLMPIRFLPARTRSIRCTSSGAPLTMQDLRAHRQLVVRESGTRARHQAAARGRAALDREPHVDLDRGGEPGLRLRLVPGIPHPRRNRRRHAEVAAAARGRREPRAALPGVRRPRRRGAGRAAACRYHPGTWPMRPAWRRGRHHEILVHPEQPREHRRGTARRAGARAQGGRSAGQAARGGPQPRRIHRRPRPVGRRAPRRAASRARARSSRWARA